MSARRQPNSALRVTLDATPLLGQRTGIGRYVEHLIQGLALRPELNVRGTAFTLRGWRSLSSHLPSGVRATNRPVPARWLRQRWATSDFPPVELLCGTTDVIHGTNFVLPPSRTAAGVLTVHDLTFLTHPETMHADNADLKILVPRGIARARMITTLSHYNRRAISEHFHFDPDRIVVAPPGVDQQWFSAISPDRTTRSRLGLPAEYFLFIGTREPRKGLDTLLAAHARLREATAAPVPDLVLVGASGWKSEHSAGPGVHILGYVDQPDLPLIAAGATALVLPSLDEGFGMPAVEALAAGCPVIVSDIPVLAEVTGRAALSFPVGDAEGLENSLRAVLQGRVPDLASRRAQAAQFNWDHCAEVTAQAYLTAAKPVRT